MLAVCNVLKESPMFEIVSNCEIFLLNFFLNTSVQEKIDGSLKAGKGKLDDQVSTSTAEMEGLMGDLANNGVVMAGKNAARFEIFLV